MLCMTIRILWIRSFSFFTSQPFPLIVLTMERRPPVKISILEKDESEVSHCWKYCQIFSYIMVIISGIATSLAMANVQGIFHHECLLYADLAISTSPENNWTIIITPHAASRWGSSSHCDFTQYCPVASVIFAGIWATIFVMCGRGGASSRKWDSTKHSKCKYIYPLVDHRIYSF